jgi:hypothetical protein
LYGLNVSAKADTNPRAPQPEEACLPEEVDIVVVAMAVVEEEAQHLLLLPHPSLQEPVQS